MSSTTNFSPILSRKFTLNNGLEMPAVGMGTFRIRSQTDITNVVDKALNAGYRMFDTAAVYGNEVYLRNAFQSLLPKYGLKREDIFVTTKLAPSHNGGGELTEGACHKSLDHLGMDYVDLYLIHWPGTAGMTTDNPQNSELRDRTWLSMVKLYKTRRAKAIGVSNYTLRHLMDLSRNYYGVTPSVNQVEWHPYYFQPELKEYCDRNNIVLQAYCSLGGTSINDKGLLKEKCVQDTAKRLGVTSSQVLLAWALQQNVAIIPKSMSSEHIKENISLDFTISKEDMEKINGLRKAQTKFAWNPNTVV